MQPYSKNKKKTFTKRYVLVFMSVGLLFHFFANYQEDFLVQIKFSIKIENKCFE